MRLKSAKHRATARELQETIHDELGPRLFAIVTKLSLLKGELRGEQERRAEEILEEAQAARRAARRIMEGAGASKGVELTAALARLAREHGGDFQDCRQAGDVTGETALELYAIAREAAHNAVKHGAAKRVRIRLKEGALEVEDNGSGLARGWKEGMGLKIMKRRAGRLGGRLALQTVAGGGTVLACHFMTTAKQ